MIGGKSYEFRYGINHILECEKKIEYQDGNRGNIDHGLEKFGSDYSLQAGSEGIEGRKMK